MTTQDNAYEEDTEQVEPLPPMVHHTVDLQKAGGESVTETIYGRLLGTFINDQEEHEKHAGEFADKRVQCFACRWTEVSIYDTRDDPEAKHPYLVHTIGRSDVPGEMDYVRRTGARNGYMIAESLISKYRGGSNLSHAARMALAEAAAYDLSIRRVWRMIISDAHVKQRDEFIPAP